jgi:hypothetical protein
MNVKPRIILPIVRSLPSYLSISKGVYSFRKIKSISHIDTSSPLSLNYFQLHVRPDLNVDCPCYHSVLDVSHLDYPFFYLPYNPHHPDRVRPSIEYAKRNEVKNIKNEFRQMLDNYKIRYDVDYFKIDDDLYVNFTNVVEFSEKDNSTLNKIKQIADGRFKDSGC